MSFASVGCPSSQVVKALWDSGAQPSLISQQIIPLGTVVYPSTIALSGVSQKPIEVVGEANITLQLGNTFITNTFVVVNKEAMKFPEGCQLILGANFIAKHSLTICATSWGILKDGVTLVNIIPAVIDNQLYTPAQPTVPGNRKASTVNNTTIVAPPCIANPTHIFQSLGSQKTC